MSLPLTVFSGGHAYHFVHRADVEFFSPPRDSERVGAFEARRVLETICARDPWRVKAFLRRSVIITSNLVFSQWDQIVRDPMTTAAAIDRLVHHAVILEMTGASYRAEAAKDRGHSGGQASDPETHT